VGTDAVWLRVVVSLQPARVLLIEGIRLGQEALIGLGQIGPGADLGLGSGNGRLEGIPELEAVGAGVGLAELVGGAANVIHFGWMVSRWLEWSEEESKLDFIEEWGGFGDESKSCVRI